jgi:hypothetical protein
MNNLDLKADVIDVRDIIARIEELREEREALADDAAGGPEGSTEDQALTAWDADEGTELADLLALMSELQGMGGDEQWEGDWYPVTLIDDVYFKDYAQELAEETGDIPADSVWPMTCIDWDQAARELRMDYSSVEVEGRTYWTR